ncbi:MAG: hypothetical protein H7257_08960 [Taibaiella sp.]|nr:hypothetical protein [Taibaiella sp.]
MQTVLIEITNSKALRLLKDLEALNLIKLLQTPGKPGLDFAERFGGKLNLSDTEYRDFQQHVSKSRVEWDNNTL